MRSKHIDGKTAVQNNNNPDSKVITRALPKLVNLLSELHRGGASEW